MPDFMRGKRKAKIGLFPVENYGHGVLLYDRRKHTADEKPAKRAARGGHGGRGHIKVDSLHCTLIIK